MSAEALPSQITARAIRLPASDVLVWPIAALGIALAVHLSMVFGRAINWDEFYHYSLIHELAAGELGKPLQTLQARLFAWCAALPGTSVDHIVAARAAMFGCVIAAAGGTYALARRFAGNAVALLSALAWLSTGFVLQHATSYRPDALAAALLMTSLAVFARARLSPAAMVAVGAFAALATLLTIKSVLYAPAFAGIAWLRWQEAERSGRASLWLTLLPLMTAGLFALFYALHAMGMSGASGGEMLANSGGKMFVPFEFPYWRHAIKAALTAPVLTLALVMLPVLLRRGAAVGAERIALAALALPLASLAFYHNTAAYWYVFILPPVAVACCISLKVLAKRYSLAGVSGMMALLAVGLWGTEDRTTIDRQRAIVATADEIFPEPVAYFDFSAMLGRYPKANVFMTPWGAENYRERGLGGTMVEALEREPVPLVVENEDFFTQALRSDAPVGEFLGPDLAALRDTYIHFWGPFWIAGEQLGPGEARITTIRVPGPYTVRDGDLLVNGQRFEAGDRIRLDRGTYALATQASSAQLVWGDRLVEPAAAAPQEPFWVEF